MRTLAAFFLKNSAMISIFLFGFLLGLQHALEADHVAAVVSLTDAGMPKRRAAFHGMAWGVGHSLTLLLFAGTAMLSGFVFSESISRWLEFAVGGMLATLGIRILYIACRDRVHLHMHRHTDGSVHFHTHSHKAEASVPHDKSPHDHAHDRASFKNSKSVLLVGMMHGVAGSSALIVFLASGMTVSAWQAVAYVFVFGLGSVMGMAILSVVVTAPMAIIISRLPRFDTYLRVTMGFATFVLGSYIMTVNYVL